MKKRNFILKISIGLLVCSLFCKADVFASGESISGLYGQSALLMDADSGRVLFEKNGYVPMPMASTTKIMTCIIALEEGNPDDVVEVSETAAKAPDVQMNICSGETYRLEDLLYGLMLESYNDVALAVMEHIPGFLKKMNRKAESLGCEDTYFVTPNGLDREDEGGIHHTTARDLALIMRYCIQNQKFLTITQTESYEIKELHGARSITAHNHNQFLHDYPGVISGKTGFTGNAGYCYVGAVKEGERTFIGVTLACGWPPHKTYKWSDMRKLFDYGTAYYQYADYDLTNLLPETLDIAGGKTDGIGGKARTALHMEQEQLHLLVKEEDKITAKIHLPDKVRAPIHEKQKIGTAELYLNKELLETISICATETIEKIDLEWCVEQTVCRLWLLGS